jgi:hypothetical protein
MPAPARFVERAAATMRRLDEKLAGEPPWVRWSFGVGHRGPAPEGHPPAPLAAQRLTEVLDRLEVA